MTSTSRKPNPFKVGDYVRRRLGTLGGTGKVGLVTAVVMKGDHECLTVDFGDRRETFAWSTYEVPRRRDGRHIL
jgi:hypothetical protein